MTLSFSLQYDHARISALSKRLIDGIQSQVEQVIRNGDDEHTYAGRHLQKLKRNLS